MVTVEECVREAERMIVDSIWKSANIEGLGTSYLNTEYIIMGVPVNTTYKESIFVNNMNRAWKYLLKNIDNDDTLFMLRELHSICGKGIIDDAGNLRTGTVRVTGTTYFPPIPDIYDLYDDLLKIDAIDDCVTRAVVVFCYLCKSQLFWDGNKRIAQLMMNRTLIKGGVGTVNIGIDKIGTLLGLLTDYYRNNDATPLCSFLMNECIYYLK